MYFKPVDMYEWVNPTHVGNVQNPLLCIYLYIHILINRQANFLSVSNMSVSATFQKLEVCVQINVLVKCFKFFCILCSIRKSTNLFFPATLLFSKRKEAQNIKHTVKSRKYNDLYYNSNLNITRGKMQKTYHPI